MANFRKRALDVLKGQKPDRLPWFADLSWWRLGEKSAGTLAPNFDGEPEGYVNLHRTLCAGLYLPLVWPYRVKIDCPQKTERKGNCEFYIYETPLGTLTETHLLMPEAATWAYGERLLKSAADIPALRYFIEAHQFEDAREDPDRWNDAYGEAGLPVVWVPRSPLSRMFVEIAGVETTVFALYENPEEMNALFDLMRSMDDEPYKYAAATKCDLVMIADNLSSEIVSPSLFRKHSLEYYSARIRQLHESGKYVLAHIDGALRGLLPILNESGLDAAEGVTPAPVGDVSPEELRSVAGEGMILWGGIPGALFSPAHSDEEFLKYARRYAEIARADGRMILGVGDQVPPGADLRRVRMVAEICENYS
ncbi:MAG TPA: uroporphyrinogen decarboxylase family protein [Candidatus Sumerlaeota bacterium]|nr:MAG: methylcobalamin:coenzyme M methyltransferase [candidate division BRC1 bacterium ADurb.Bin183]HOE62209.1 uroporphyrinogen decarboxylase family protein [Candidatus Sumerlaeota bacterium]HRR30968.1 uroporphyrinogen decarboxylase family protein [Candidatus Sumerlaeia bacterium]HON49124.1 uroporphyrinogen decarboxylase family protein [Candidatus Sumerlaeota bacterium]HOR64269.1 uroporphyrinogen decarboxylase family protein [Candidatus Sumerlaeota bacterium]